MCQKYIIIVIISYYIVQIQLSGVSDCNQWTADKGSIKLVDFTTTLIRIMNGCGCNFTISHFNQSGFNCFDSSPNFVTFRGSMDAYSDSIADEVIETVKIWVASQSSASILGEVLYINQECPVLISDYNVPECSSSGSKSISTIVIIIIASLSSCVLGAIFLLICAISSLRLVKHQ